METPTYSHNGEDGYQTERRESHWQPALRPDAQDTTEDDAPVHATRPYAAFTHSFYDKTISALNEVVDRDHKEMVDPELPSDDDDERLDPAWGIRRTDTSRILEGVHRSASFPQFEPEGSPPQNEFTPEAPIATMKSSQLEDLLNESNEEMSYDTGASAGIDADMPIGQTEQLGFIQEADEPESESMSNRYQEGLPLIDSQHQPTELSTAVSSELRSGDTFATDTNEEAASFFDQPTSNSQELQVPPGLDRKSTYDVLDSMHIQRKEITDYSIPDDTEIEPAPSIEASLVEHGFPTSIDKDIARSDAFAQEVSADNFFEPTASTEDNTLDLQTHDHSIQDASSTDPVPDSQFDAFAQESSADDFFSAAGITESKQPESTDAIWAAVLDDDEFLVEDADDLLPDSEPGSPSSFIASLQDGGAAPVPNLETQNNMTATRSVQPNSNRTTSNPYAPHQPSTSNMMQLSPKAHGNAGFSQAGFTPINPFQPQIQRPDLGPRAESFADQAKGGYKSPYDLPMDLAKPKRKPVPQRTIAVSQKGVPLPPPRTTSRSSEMPLASPFTPTNQTFASMAGSPMTTPLQAATTNSPGVSTPAQRPSTASSAFFEELPVASRARPPPGPGRYTSSQSFAAPPPQLLPQGPLGQNSPTFPSQASPPRAADLAAQFQLQPPERLDPYANVALQPPPIVPTVPTSRYSPAPPASLAAPRAAPSPRYSPAPQSQPPTGPSRYVSQPVGAQPMPPAPAASNRYVSQPVSAPQSANATLQFQPRTSSPLAYQRPTPNEQVNNTMPPPSVPRSSAVPLNNAILSSPPKPTSQGRPSGPNPLPSFPPSAGFDAATQIIPPPLKRSQTQSPSRFQSAAPTFAMRPPDSGVDRPASAYSHLPSVNPAAFPTSSAVPQSTWSRAAPSSLEFVLPNDNTRDDVLERWKGAPVFRFGFGGNVVTCFPKHTPRFSSSLTKPQIKPTAGEVLVRKTKDVLPLSEHVASFPGPLRGKSKKKDVLNWLSTSITRLESESPSFLGIAQTLPDPRTCHDEKVLLWKIVKVLVEHDGSLETNADALKAVNAILAPEVHAIDESTASRLRSDSNPTGIYRPAGATARLDSTDPLAVENLRKHLMKGKRDDAVWHAVDNRLWSHALLISSTMDRAIWKQVVQEFVRQEVKTIGSNAESLAAIYEIFGGNVDDSIDQLVPPSARAGLQMVSKVDPTGPTKNALDGLDRWKETLILVLNNRSIDDQKALVALARLLGDYGRVAAAHICLLFARSPAFPSLFGGVDDPQSSITLLGADRRFGMVQKDEDAMLLTEVYEFATCTLANAATAMPMPYLASYKLQRAKQLSDHGLKTEAQAYCDAIAASIGTKTKVSPYYHPILLGEVEDLSNRLKQVPVQSSSWITKPTIEKVSGSIFSKFTNFVAGDDSDAESKGSGKEAAAEVGPFANVSGSPSLSRSGSQADLYGGFPAITPVMPTAPGGSRYAPNGMSSARSSSEIGRGRPSLDSQRSPPSTSYGQDSRQSLYAPMMQNLPPTRGTNAYQPFGTSSGQQLGTSPSLSNYQATPPQSSYMPMGAQHQSSTSLSEQRPDAYVPTPPPEEHIPYMPAPPAESEQPAYGGYMPTPQPIMEAELQDNQADSEQTPAYDATHSYGYEPPADTGYVPYKPEPDSEDDSRKQKPKKKSFMDDDGDDYAPVARAQPSQPVPSANGNDATARRKAADDATNAAFLAAAAEDEQRAKDQAAAKKSGSWFGGWLGGKKAAGDSLDTSSSGGGGGGADAKVHRAKLGESKMKLYYDENLKKWVNPDDPDSGKAKAGPAPPPRSGGTPIGGGSMLPPRSGTGSGPPMSMTASRSGTPMAEGGVPPLPPSATNTALPPSNGAAGIPLPPSTAGTPVLGAGPPRAAPTPGSTTSIDDLLGPAVGGGSMRAKGAKGAKKKAGRYVDVMAQS